VWKALLIGAFAFVVALVTVGLLRPTDQSHQQEYRQSSEASTQQRALEDESWETLWKRTKSDPVAFFTAVLSVTTAALFILSLVQIWFLIKADRTANISAKAATEAAEIAKKSLVAANRAWLSPTNAILTKPMEDGLPIRIQIRIVNVGREPALGVVWKMNPFPVPYIPLSDGTEPSISPNVSCEGLKPREPDGLVIYPPGGINYWLPFDIEDSGENRKFFEAVMARQSTLIIEGCFAYRVGKEPHTSAFRFFLRDRPGEPSWTMQDGKPAPNWHFNAMLSGNEAN